MKLFFNAIALNDEKLMGGGVKMSVKISSKTTDILKTAS